MSAQRKKVARKARVSELQRLDHPDHYLSRELSQIEFIWRVLAQAQDPAVPLLERLRFLAISCSVLDEFYEVRVAGLKQQVVHNIPNPDPDPLTSKELLVRIDAAARALVSEQYRLLTEEIRPGLSEEGIRLLHRQQWSPAQAEWVRDHFRRDILPVLTPVGLDPSHPFPQILNKSLNFIVTLQGSDAYGRDTGLAIVQAPRILPRVLQFPAALAKAPTDLLLLSSMIRAQVGDLFPGMEIGGCYQFRVTRNSDLWVDEEEVDDLLHALRGELPRRRYSEAVRLEVEASCPQEVTEFLLREFTLTPNDLFLVNGPVNLHRLEAIHGLVDRPDLKYPAFTPGVPEAIAAANDPFEAVRRSDVLLHHPFQSFSPVLDLLRAAAKDPSVLAIKQTLYRTVVDSPVAEALLAAAQAGKEVTAVVELRARFDEAANIELATRLQEVGARVVYGVVGLKTHAKMLMIVRRESDGLRRYCHLGTGNYHTRTARAYTDLGLITCDAAIGQDVHEVFQQITGLGSTAPLRHLIQSPFQLRDRIIAMIDAEAEAAAHGKPARIIAKMNALLEPEVIRALYRASRAGVRIDLIVRGMCALRPGVPGLSENIRVRSIVGRFLEHTRIFHFLAGGDGVVYLSSADWMPRNLLRRVEVAFPVKSPELRQRVLSEGIDPYLADNTQAWIMQPDGHFVRAEKDGQKPFAAQTALLQQLSSR